MNFIHKNAAITKDDITKLDKLAYYTIIAFRRMLNKVNYTETKIDGLLFNLYRSIRSNLIETFNAKDTKNVISILSYGGLNRKLAKNGVKLLKNLYENLKSLGTIFQVINSAKEYKPSYLLANQGEYESVVNAKNTEMYNVSFKQHSQVINVKDTGEETYKTIINPKKNKIKKALNGGYKFKEPKVLEINITNTCSEINTYFKQILNDFLNNNLLDNNNLKNARPGPALTFLTVMTELFVCDKNNFNTKEAICKNLVIQRGRFSNKEFDSFSSDIISPIVSDLYRLRYTNEDTYAFVNKSHHVIVQIIGHANNYAQRTTLKHMYKDTLLYGSVVDFYGTVGGDFKSFIVCLDNSRFFNSVLEDDFKSKTLLLYDVSLFKITDTNGIIAKKMEPVKRGITMTVIAGVGSAIKKKFTGKKKKKTEIKDDGDDEDQEGGTSKNDEDEDDIEEGEEKGEDEGEGESEGKGEDEGDKQTKEPVAYSEDYLTMFHLYNIISLYTNVPDIISAITNIKETEKDKQIHSQIKLNNSLYDVLLSVRNLKQKQH